MSRIVIDLTLLYITPNSSDFGFPRVGTVPPVEKQYRELLF
jgi:hypothetical protein